jgi:mono/diheme cytochrome c family protein
MKKDVQNKNLRKSVAVDAEPTTRSGAVYLPMWLTGILGLLLYWSCYYIDEHGGRFSEVVYSPYKSTNELATLVPGGGDPLAALGAMKYRQVCAPCHQESGMGVPNQFPPLGGSEWVNAPGAGRMIRIVQTGITGPLKVKGTDWNLTMPPMGATMTDEELAAVISYVRSAFGNKAPKATPAQVKAVRGALGGRTDPHTQEEILKVPEAE